MKYELIQSLKISDASIMSKEKFRSAKISYNHSNNASKYDNEFWDNQEIPQYILQLLNKQLKLIND